MDFYTKEIRSGYDWKAFEKTVARMIEHAGWKNVAVIGGSGDMGGDVHGIRDGKSWVFQAKAVSGDKYIGTKAVDEAVHALSVYGCDQAVVVTNGTFTSSAVKRRDQLEKNGFSVKLWNGAFLSDFMEKIPNDNGLIKKSRPYQRDIVDAVMNKYHRGEKKAFYIVATGLGKTHIASSIARKLWDEGNRRFLVLCHTIPLAQQLEKDFWRQLSKEIPTSVFYDGIPPKTQEGISFGLYQSLYGYLPGIDQDQFDVIIVDEAHHALSHGFRTCIESFAPKFLIGMTATPWRQDGKSLSDVFGDPVATMSLVDGMNQGFLSKVDYRIFCDNINWEEVPSLSKKRLSIKDLNKRLFLPQRDEAVITRIKETIADTKNPRIAIFSPSRAHGEKFAGMMNAEGISCTALSCGDKVETRKRLLEFETGKYQAVTAVDVMNEGIDVPDVNILVFLRATHSRRIFVQQLGRGLRLHEGKEKVIVLDFVSDIRRLAEVTDMNNEGRIKGTDETLFLREGFVSFSNERVGKFVNEWIEDVADLSEIDSTAKLTFPEDFI